MVSKEAECVVGPLLARKARLAGVPYTLIDGDQPSLLIGLISWARTLGLPFVAAGKSSEYDYVFDAEAGIVTWQDQQVAAPRLSEIWHLEGNCSEPIVEHRAAGSVWVPFGRHDPAPRARHRF